MIENRVNELKRHTNTKSRCLKVCLCDGGEVLEPVGGVRELSDLLVLQAQGLHDLPLVLP